MTPLCFFANYIFNFFSEFIYQAKLKHLMWLHTANRTQSHVGAIRILSHVCNYFHLRLFGCVCMSVYGSPTHTCALACGWLVGSCSVRCVCMCARAYVRMRLGVCVHLTNKSTNMWVTCLIFAEILYRLFLNLSYSHFYFILLFHFVGS